VPLAPSEYGQGDEGTWWGEGTGYVSKLSSLCLSVTQHGNFSTTWPRTTSQAAQSKRERASPMVSSFRATPQRKQTQTDLANVLTAGVCPNELDFAVSWQRLGPDRLPELKKQCHVQT
ncbi:hypothetical protein P7K49_031323, partial [Saguinus oedipus]